MPHVDNEDGHQYSFLCTILDEDNFNENYGGEDVNDGDDDDNDEEDDDDEDLTNILSSVQS